MAEIRKDDQGRFLTKGLTERQFAAVFKQIETAQKRNRRQRAKKILTAAQLRSKSPASLAKLGAKADGTPFTVNDLIEMEKVSKRHQQRYKSEQDGITYDEMIAGSQQIDIKRANNQVSDGSGITRANLSKIHSNQIAVRVQASEKSVHEEHQVKIRLEQWQEFLLNPPKDDYKLAVKAACRGRISFDCSCGRHQYWYRYLATVGRYAITPPKETAFPKIRNPSGKGIACKHVLKAAVMLQSIAWQRLLQSNMESQAKTKGFADDRKLQKFLTEKEVKETTAKNRSLKIDQAKSEAEVLKQYKAYQRSQAAFEKKIKADKRLQDRLKNALKRKRHAETQTGKAKARLQNEKKAKAKIAKELQASKDMIKMMFSLVKDTYLMNGKTKQDAITDIAKKMNVSPSVVKEAIK